MTLTLKQAVMWISDREERTFEGTVHMLLVLGVTNYLSTANPKTALDVLQRELCDKK